MKLLIKSCVKRNYFASWERVALFDVRHPFQMVIRAKSRMP